MSDSYFFILNKKRTKLMVQVLREVYLFDMIILDGQPSHEALKDLIEFTQRQIDSQDKTNAIYHTPEYLAAQQKEAEEFMNELVEFEQLKEIKARHLAEVGRHE